MTTASRVTLAQNQSINEAFESFENNYAKKRNEILELPPSLNSEKLKIGLLQYDNLQGYNQAGVQVLSHRYVDESTLKMQRSMRVGATVTAVGFCLASAIGLIYSGSKLLLHSLFNRGDLDEAYSSTAKAFTVGSVAGIANSASHENLNWGIGAAGMGLLSRFINKPWGLALFSVFDGLNAMGMGEVNCRDKKNVMASPRSIFNKPALSVFKFLMPYEQAVKTFWNRLTTPRGWNKIFSDEPYAVFQSAGGGLIAGGGILGIASAFSGFMSDKVKQLFYLPYSITSLLNILALGRDGVAVNYRAKNMDGRKPGENKMMKIEGWGKLTASFPLALNYFVLGLKGIGLDFNGVSEHISMALRTFGVAIAYAGFAAQSAIKFFVPDLFGPKSKEVIKVLLDQNVVMDKYKKMFDDISENKGHRANEQHQSDIFEPVINNDKYAELLNAVSNTETFEILKHKSLTGLPSLGFMNRAYLNRYIHSRRVCSLGIIFFDNLLKATTDPEFKKYLLEHEEAFKLASLTHDNGHSKLPRCHLAEDAIYGLNNDELSVDGLKEGSDIYNTVINYYLENANKLGIENPQEHAENVLTLTRKIIGLKHPLSKLYKWADFCEYGRSRGGDYSTAFDFSAWTKEDYEEFAQTRRMFIDENENIQIGFNEAGAITAFKQIYYRLIFNAYLNQHPVVVSRETAYKVGIQNSNLTSKEVFGMSEPDFDAKADNGIRNYNNSSVIKNRYVFGGEKAYCGYGPKEKIYVVKENNAGKPEVYEFLDYVERVLKFSNPEAYACLNPMIKALANNPTQIELHIQTTNSLNKNEAVPASVIEDQLRYEQARTANYALAT